MARICDFHKLLIFILVEKFLFQVLYTPCFRSFLFLALQEVCISFNVILIIKGDHKFNPKCHKPVTVNVDFQVSYCF